MRCRVRGVAWGGWWLLFVVVLVGLLLWWSWWCCWWWLWREKIETRFSSLKTAQTIALHVDAWTCFCSADDTHKSSSRKHHRLQWPCKARPTVFLATGVRRTSVRHETVAQVRKSRTGGAWEWEDARIVSKSSNNHKPRSVPSFST